MGHCNIKTLAVMLMGIQVLYLLVNIWNQENFSLRSKAPTIVPPVTTESSLNETVEAFLYEYESYCEQFLLANQSHNEFLSGVLTQPLCSCVPNGLVGRMNVSNSTESLPSIGELELKHTELSSGGTWIPQSCMARHYVAIIVPYRDREEHLKALLSVLHPMLQRQQLRYTVYVVEQAEPEVFNKASLMNVAFLIARSQADFDCFIFQDVDMLPEDDRNFYTCSSLPRHVGSHLSKWDYKLPYDGLFGGVTAFKPEHFELVNGFSNLYYGWGGEDDDMYNRILAKNMSIIRFSASVARFTMITHKSDVGNPSSPFRNNAFKFRPMLYKFDGLNSLRYQVVSYEQRPLYTWLYVKLPPHPVYFKGSFRAEVTSTSGRLNVSLVLLLFGLALARAKNFVNLASFFQLLYSLS